MKLQIKQLFLVTILLFLSLYSVSQVSKTTVEVDKRFHDFGKIKEDGGKVRAVFTFKNTGTTKLLIINAEPSCGCTVGEWTKDSIAPGKTGIVTAIFDPKNMVGIIDKTLGIYTNAQFAKVVVLELRGEVISRDRTMDDIFPYRAGNLMFDKETVDLKDILHNKKDSAFIVMYNDGQYPIKINNTSPLPEGIKVRPDKKIIDPNEEVRLFVTIDGNKFQELGFFNKAFRLITDDPEFPEKNVFIFGSIKYNFGNLSKKELKSAPKFSINSKEKDFGDQQIGSFVTTTFTITNKGKEDLKILSLKAQCHCTEPSIDKTVIKKNETATLTIKFDLMGNAGNVQKPVTIYTNDSKNPTVNVILKARLY